jgi:hypothetical protein
MGWDVNIFHRNDHYITNADYWSHLGADLCFDPLFKTYLDLTRTLRNENPPPSSFPMKPENMPYYRGPRVITPNDSNTSSDASHCQTIVSRVLVDNCHGLCHLSNIPVKFGNFGRVTPSTSRSLHNDKFPCYALQVRNSVGRSTHFRVDTLPQLFKLETCRFMSHWPAIPSNRDAPSFRSLSHAVKFLALQPRCKITFGHWGTLPSSMVT